MEEDKTNYKIISQFIQKSKAFNGFSEFNEFQKEMKEKLAQSTSQYYENFGNIIEETYKSNPKVKIANKIIERQAKFHIKENKHERKDFEEFANGEVAAVDGTYLTIINQHNIKVLTFLIGTYNYKDGFNENFNLYHTNLTYEEMVDTKTSLYQQYMKITQQENFLDHSLLMLYFERKFAVDKLSDKKIVFIDGPLIHEKMLYFKEGLDLYSDLFNSKTSYIGIIKDLNSTNKLSQVASDLQTGEYRIVEKVSDHINYKEKIEDIDDIIRIVFNAGYKSFGLEIRVKDLDKLKYVWADIPVMHPGYELPHLINLTDKFLKERRTNMFENIYQKTIIENTPEKHKGNGIFLNAKNERSLR